MIIKLLLILILTIYPYSNDTIDNENALISNQNEIVKKEPVNTKKEKPINIEKPIGKLIINNININKPLYNINSKHNNIEENVTILKSSKDPSSKNSLIVLGAHSGTGKIAYFNDLDKLKINDEIKLIYYNKEYTYMVTDIFTQEKNGHINISKKDTSQLILTTCDKENKKRQLIIESIIKET